MYEPREGSWIQDHPHVLELAYEFTEQAFMGLDPLWQRIGYDRVERLIQPVEDFMKKLMFDCNVCGQCMLHYSGMTCPMNCPKNLRNGPCGGVRADGHCEVIPEQYCVWYKAFNRSRKMPIYGNDIINLQPMHDWEHEETSAWVNLLREKHGEIERAQEEIVDCEITVPAGPGPESSAKLPGSLAFGVVGGLLATFALSAIFVRKK